MTIDQNEPIPARVSHTKGPGVSLFQRRSNQCAYPIQGRRENLRCCGRQAEKRKPYCATHDRRAHLPKPVLSL